MKYYAPREFYAPNRIGEEIRLRHVAVGPIFRSSYHAERHVLGKSEVV